MAVLLIRLCGPMQSWGTQSRFTKRDTELEPSKSGVIGLLCAALGKPRDEREYQISPSINELSALKMGVRVDREGAMKCDYHTALKVAKAGGGIKDCEPSHRYYLADACFLVALQGNDTGLLERLHEALKNPAWQLFLGRKSFVLGLPAWLKDGFRHDQNDLKEVLKSYPYLCSEIYPRDSLQKLRLELETEYGAGERVKHDQPESFAIGNRRFGLRYVSIDSVERSKLPRPKEEQCILLA